MDVTPGRWLPLTPDYIEALPNKAGVFEVANLVRNVLYIARGDGRLRERVAAMGPVPNHLPPCPGGHYFRFELTQEEDAALGRRIKSFQSRHRGRLPVGNLHEDQTVREARCAA
jgi:hypothetical protein